MNQAKKRSFIIVANRLPVRRVEYDGEVDWLKSPGGLVSALTPVLERSPGAWVGWSGSTGPAPEPFAKGGLLNVPVPISEAELNQYYSGFCNRTVWPLYHDAVRPPEYHRRWWARYLAVNERFAQAAAEASEPRGRVWVHDYHLQLVPGMIREPRVMDTLNFVQTRQPLCDLRRVL